MRDDDRRLQRGRRLLFGPNDREALYTAKVMLRLKPEFQRAVRMLAESFAVEQLTQTAEALKASEKGSS